MMLLSRIGLGFSRVKNSGCTLGFTCLLTCFLNNVFCFQSLFGLLLRNTLEKALRFTFPFFTAFECALVLDDSHKTVSICQIIVLNKSSVKLPVIHLLDTCQMFVIPNSLSLKRLTSILSKIRTYENSAAG